MSTAISTDSGKRKYNGIRQREQGREYPVPFSLTFRPFGVRIYKALNGKSKHKELSREKPFAARLHFPLLNRSGSIGHKAVSEKPDGLSPLYDKWVILTLRAGILSEFRW